MKYQNILLFVFLAGLQDLRSVDGYGLTSEKIQDLAHLAGTAPRNLLRRYNVKNKRLVDLVKEPDSFMNRIAIKDLIQAEVGLNDLDSNGDTALTIAERNGHEDIVELLRPYDALRVRSIDRLFSDEPMPTSYVNNDMSEKEFQNGITLFQEDLQDYWVDRLQSAYSIFIKDHNPQPLIDFFCKDIWERSGLIDVIFSSFKSQQHLELLLDVLKNKASTDEEKLKLQSLKDLLIDQNYNIAAGKIQRFWRDYKGNQIKKLEDLKKGNSLMLRAYRNAYRNLNSIFRKPL